jgi:hypothetical protein
MSRGLFGKLAAAVVFVFASQMTAACSRIVSVDPLLADVPPSKARWQGAYVGALDPDKERGFEMLLRVQPRRSGGYEFTLHARGDGGDIFASSAPLDLVGRGEMRIADLDEGYAVAQTRCEISVPLRGSEMANKADVLEQLMTSARRLGELSDKGPRPRHIGPYVYALIRGGPARPEAILGLDGTSAVEEAAGGTGFAFDKWEGGTGEGMLAGAGMIFEGDDIHLSGPSGSAKEFFTKLARKVFAGEAKNTIVWTRVDRTKLEGLRLNDRYPASGRAGAWCNLSLVRSSD